MVADVEYIDRFQQGLPELVEPWPFQRHWCLDDLRSVEAAYVIVGYDMLAPLLLQDLLVLNQWYSSAHTDLFF